ncbi:MAG: 3-hydroxyacyl-CoA dehydrogenase NAD-binding domain-containing protein [Gammaproteobacteria bacterium]|nr:3-hydroxyacyl-CoA dehydrogenase NAD-binding domain-containing protein [Gammaproteobacteria bacterium]
MSENIKINIGSDGIAILEIDVKDRPMNVITSDFAKELAERVEQVTTDEKIIGAIITSSKNDFMAGAELKSMLPSLMKLSNASEMVDAVVQSNGVSRNIETCGKPFVAAINGTALGGGLEICLACHYRIAIDRPDAVLGLPEVLVGLLPGGGGTQRLPRMIGVQNALELMTQGKHIKPAVAKSMGIVDELSSKEDLIGKAKQWIIDVGDPVKPWDKKGFKVPGGFDPNTTSTIQVFSIVNAMVAKNTNHNYPAPISIVSSVYEGCQVPIDTGLRIESKYFVKLLRDPVAGNMIRSLFINKQSADKLRARPKDVEKSKVTNLGMLGAGMMGSGIALVSAQAGINVVLLDSTIESATKGKKYTEKYLEKSIALKKMTSEKAKVIIDRIQVTTDFNDLKDCDLIIEAVFENREIKADVTQKTEKVIADSVIFASNTSTLPITGLAKASSRPKSFIGMHFFSPVERMPLVEIIMGEESSDEALAKSLDYIQQIRKTPMVINDSRGFFTSRVFSQACNEANEMLREGVLPALIENGARQAGYPVGPLAVQDETSIELGHKIHVQTIEDIGDEYKPQSAVDVAEKMYELGRLGKKYRKGFYEYPEDGPKKIWSGLAEAFPVSQTQPDLQLIKDRLMTIQSLDAYRCLEENVLTSPDDGDIGSIFGWGFPPWSGGVFSYIDTVGIKAFVERCDDFHKRFGERFKVPDSLRERANKNESFYS